MDIRQQVLDELIARKWSRSELARRLKKRVPESTLFRWLSDHIEPGESRSIDLDHLAAVLDVLGLEVKAKARRRRRVKRV